MKIFFSRTTKPENLRFTKQLPDIVQIHICTNHGLRGSVGTTVGKPCLHEYILEKKIFDFSGTRRPISMKLYINHLFPKGIQVCRNKGSGSLQMGDNCKNAKKGGASLNNFSQEPLG
jgi:hypothetical protein